MKIKTCSVLLTTYHDAFLRRGGGEFELISVSENLKALGLIADIYGPYARSIDSYDAIIHFSVHSGGLALLRRVHDEGKPIILWPNLWLHENHPSAPPSEVEEMVKYSQTVVFKSRAELDNFRNRYSVPDYKVKFVKNGVDESFLHHAPKGVFSALYHITDYAISVGGIEPIKNQLTTIRALRSISTPIVFIGAPRNLEYYRKCKLEAPPHHHFIDTIPYRSKVFRSALADAALYLELSFEPPGASAIEAALSGCQLLLPDMDWCREHFGNYGIYVKPDNPEEIYQGFLATLNTRKKWLEPAPNLKEYVLPKAIIPLYEIIKEVI
jgi:glycosyltransferase involved in cell wall biosynthesis